jgi:hypothetical protein
LSFQEGSVAQQVLNDQARYPNRGQQMRSGTIDSMKFEKFVFVIMGPNKSRLLMPEVLPPDHFKGDENEPSFLDLTAGSARRVGWMTCCK